MDHSPVDLRTLTPVQLLDQPASLLREVRLKTHSLPLRLRALNMLTYALDMLYIQRLPALIQRAASDQAAAGHLRSVTDGSLAILDEAAALLHDELLPHLADRGLTLLPMDRLNPEQCAATLRHFDARIRPLLTPLAVDAGRPFPQISAHSLNLLAVLSRPNSFDIDMPSFARLKVPRAVARLTELPPSTLANGGPHRDFVLSEDIVRHYVGSLFPGMVVTGVYQFRLLRGAVNGNGQPAGRHTALARQKAWPVVRLDVEADMPGWVLRWLQENMDAPDAVVLRRQPPLGAGSLAAEWAERASGSL
jgi:polyphosphate kinase